MYEMSTERIMDGTPEQAWAIQADVDAWPRWNSHELAAHLDGPFAAGTQGWSNPRGGPATTWTITAADEPHSWSSRSPLPLGELTGTRTFEATADGRLRCTATMRATGPLQVLFRLWFGRGIRRDMLLTFDELEAEIRRRAAAH